MYSVDKFDLRFFFFELQENTLPLNATDGNYSEEPTYTWI